MSLRVEIDLSRLITDPTKFGFVYGGGTFGGITDEQGVRRPASSRIIIDKINNHYGIRVFNEDQILIAYEGFSENIDREILSRILQVIENAFKRGHEVVLLTCGTDAMQYVASAIKDWQKLNWQWLSERRNADGSSKKAFVVITGSNHPLDYNGTDAWGNLEFSTVTGNELLLSPENDTQIATFVTFHNRKIPPPSLVKGPPNGEPQGVDFYDGESDEYLKNVWLWQTAKAMAIVGKLEAHLKTEMNYNPFNPLNSDGHFLLYDVNKILDGHSGLYECVIPGFTQAVLLTLFHSGTANTNPSRPDLNVAKLVSDLRRDHGIVCFGVTENEEPVTLRAYDTGVALRESGLVPCYNMGCLEAMAKICACSRDFSGVELIQRVLSNDVGEIDPNAITDVEDLLRYHATLERVKVTV